MPKIVLRTSTSNYWKPYFGIHSYRDFGSDIGCIPPGDSWHVRFKYIHLPPEVPYLMKPTHKSGCILHRECPQEIFGYLTIPVGM